MNKQTKWPVTVNEPAKSLPSLYGFIIKDTHTPLDDKPRKKVVFLISGVHKSGH